MLKKLFWVIPAGFIAILGGCTVFVATPEETTIKARNDLTAMSVDVNGKSTNIEGIDLIDITIGDVYFPYIEYGTTSAVKVTYRSGNVSVYIDTAVVSTKVLGQTVFIPFPNISPMSARINANQSNTVVFDESTATVIFDALAKKKVPQTP